MSEFKNQGSLLGDFAGGVTKEFITKKEKFVGVLGTLLLLSFAGLALYKVLPYVNAFLSGAIDAGFKILVLGGMALAAFIVITFLLQPRTWTLLWHWQRAFAMKLTRLTIKADPIGRLRAFADEYLEEALARYKAAMARVEAQLERTRGNIEKSGADHKETVGTVQGLKKHHYDAREAWDSDEFRLQFQVSSQRLKFLEDTLEKLKAQEARLDMVTKILDKIRRIFQFKIASTRQTAEFLEMQYVSARETAAALEEASAAWGFGDMAQMDRMTRQYMEEQISGWVGQIEVFLKSVPELTTLADLKGEMAEDEMMERLRNWEATADERFLQAQQEKEKLEITGPKAAFEVIATAAKKEDPRRYRGLLGSRDPKDHERPR